MPLPRKLSPSAVATIRSTPIRYGAITALARRYGVSHESVRRVLRGMVFKRELRGTNQTAAP